MADDEDAGSKYAYLLQPIKDLEKNFAIDLVVLLEEYTSQLNALAEAEEFQRDNAHRFNFAEAAMLIHGSASVFCRKVDLVHNQALNFFEVLKTTKEKKKRRDGDNDDGDDGFEDDNEQGDPFVAVPVDPCKLQNFSKLKPANLTSLVTKNPKLPVPSISIMPMSLMPLADYEKCNVPIYNTKNKNEVVGKKDDFKINTGYMSQSGALLLDLLNDALVDQFITEKIFTPTRDEDSGRCSPEMMDDPAAETDLPQLPSSQDLFLGRPSNIVEVVRRGAGSMDVPTLVRQSSIYIQPDAKASQPLAALPEADFSDMDGGGFDDYDEVIPAPPVKKVDPWEVDDAVDVDLLIDKLKDPFENDGWKQKECKESNNCVNIDAVLGKKKKAEEKRDRKQKYMETIEFVNDQIYCFGRKQKVKRDLGLGIEHKWEIDAILPYIHEQQKRRERVRREMAAQRKREDRQERRVSGKVFRPNLEYDEDDDFAAGGHDDEPTHMDGGNIRNNFVQANSIKRPLMADFDDADLAADLNFPALFVGPDAENENEVSQLRPDVEKIHPGMSLEDIITYYRKKYWEQTAEAMSKLAARVQEWDEKMQPLLEEEETRKEFNIHEYGTEMLDLFGKLGDVRTLPRLLRGKVHYEISRYFLSTLMMANTMNLEIINEQQKGPDPLKMMQLKLLTRDRHHEAIEGHGSF